VVSVETLNVAGYLARPSRCAALTVVVAGRSMAAISRRCHGGGLALATADCTACGL
jgi:hypothetical protein